MSLDRGEGWEEVRPAGRELVPPKPAVPLRVLQTFVSPGALGDALRTHPAWFVTGLLGAVLVTVATAAIPVEVWTEFARAQAMAQGQAVPEGGMAGNLFRIIGMSAAPVVWFLALLVFSAVLWFVFAFVLGDEGRYVQYLAALSHANLIGALGTLVVTPLKIARRDPQLTLSIGTYVEAFLDDGFLYFWLKGMDLFALWSWVALAVMVSRFDARRTTSSAVVVVLILFAGIVAGVAWLQTAFAP